MAAPGPVERETLAELAPAYAAREAFAGGASLRFLEGGAGATTVVLLHGRGNAAITWLPHLAPLAARYRVLAPDLPGFGGSSARYPGGGAEAALRFFADPIERWLGETARGPVALVGHSLGGLVALELVLRGAIRVERLVLIGAMGLGPAMSLGSRLFFRAGPERVAALVGPRAFRRIAPLPRSPVGERLTRLEYELHTANGPRQDGSSAFDALCPLIGAPLHRQARLGEIAIPCLLLHGARDQVFPAAAALSAAARMPSARVEILPLGHSPHQDDPDRIRGLIVDFVG